MNNTDIGSECIDTCWWPHTCSQLGKCRKKLTSSADKAPDIDHLKNRLHSNIMGCPSYTTVEERQDCLTAIEQLQAENAALQAKCDSMERVTHEALSVCTAMESLEFIGIADEKACFQMDGNRKFAALPGDKIFMILPQESASE